MTIVIPNPDREFTVKVSLQLPLVKSESDWNLDSHKESIKALIENYIATEVEDVKVIEIVEVDNGNS